MCMNTCGDGVQAVGVREECDDGNSVSGDGEFVCMCVRVCVCAYVRRWRAGYWCALGM